MTPANLRERAKRVGEAAIHNPYLVMAGGEVWDHDRLSTAGACQGCRAERAALVELEAAVAEEREACALLAIDAAGRWSSDIDAVAVAMRARGQR